MERVPTAEWANYYFFTHTYERDRYYNKKYL